MTSEWRTIRAADFIDFNPRLSLKKGDIATKVAMDKLKPFTKKIPETEKAEFNGGAKFCNGDTVMARITPCLENGKTAYVDMLDDGEIGFGSTEFIVMRAKTGISDPQFVYYTAINPVFRNVAIKSMVGSSGRQRVQQSVLEELELSVPDLDEQRRIGDFLARIDEKIALNDRINDNLEQQLHQLFIQTFNGCDTNISLGKVVKTTSGGTPARKHREYYSNGTINWVKSKELTGQYLFDTEESLTSLGVAMSSAKILPAHSVLIAMYGATVGEHGITTKEMACNQAICALLENKDYPYTYLFQIAKENQQNLVNLAIGSAQQNISQILLKQLSVHSDVATIHQYHCLALPLHKEIELLQSENRLLNTTRDALLPELMTGELDLSSVDF